MNIINKVKIHPGSIIQNRYLVQNLLGEGGFGSVYKGRDTVLEIPVAVKMLFDNSTESVEQFKSEAKILAKLKHPHLPRVTDYFSQNGIHFLVMDYIDGADLQSILKKNKSPLECNKTIDWLSQILNALEYIHSKNVVHRDIKPGNIRVTPSGFASLVDFGISKADSRMMTAPAIKNAFTPFMAAPEQCQTYGKTTPLSDIYAAGATLYYLLTNTLPGDAISRLMGENLKLPHKLNPLISRQLSDTVIKSMSLEPKKRYQSASEMKYAIQKSVTANNNISPGVSGPLHGKSQYLTFRRDIRRI